MSPRSFRHAAAGWQADSQIACSAEISVLKPPNATSVPDDPYTRVMNASKRILRYDDDLSEQVLSEVLAMMPGPEQVNYPGENAPDCCWKR